MANEYLMYIMSSEWRQKSLNVQRMTQNHCILFPWLLSNHAHHLTYRNMKREMPIRDIIPLSRKAHSLVHTPLLWKSWLRPWINFLLRLLMVFWIVFYFGGRANHVGVKKDKNKRVY